MLQNFQVESKESIHPFGDNFFALDENTEWKQKKLVVSTKPKSNTYNLVQLKSSSERKFEIKREHDSVERAISSEARIHKEHFTTTKRPGVTSFTGVKPQTFVDDQLHDVEYENVCKAMKT